MRQQINLYQAVLIDTPEPLRLRQVGLILALFLALLAVLTLFSFWQMRDVSQQLVSLAEQQREKAELVATLERQYPERQKSVLLDTEIARSRDLLAGQKKLLGYFSVREEGNNDRILEILDGLARNRQKGLWLQRIRLTANGRNIALAGSALRPEQVPLYLQSLGEKGVLHGQVFSRLQLSRLQERPGQVAFSLESVEEQ